MEEAVSKFLRHEINFRSGFLEAFKAKNKAKREFGKFKRNDLES